MNSADFRETINKIVTGLNKAGFSRRDYRTGDTAELSQTPDNPEPEQTAISSEAEQPEDDFSDVNTKDVKAVLESIVLAAKAGINAMESAATVKAQDDQAASQEDGRFVGCELGEMLTQKSWMN